jgi:hypothetical protein
LLFGVLGLILLRVFQKLNIQTKSL